MGSKGWNRRFVDALTGPVDKVLIPGLTLSFSTDKPEIRGNRTPELSILAKPFCVVGASATRESVLSSVL